MIVPSDRETRRVFGCLFAMLLVVGAGVGAFITVLALGVQ